VAKPVVGDQDGIGLDPEAVHDGAVAWLKRHAGDHADLRVAQRLDETREELRLDVHVVVGEHDHLAIAAGRQRVDRSPEPQVLLVDDDVGVREALPDRRGIPAAIHGDVHAMRDRLALEVLKARQHEAVRVHRHDHDVDARRHVRFPSASG
jgi:hypothetical protein